MLYLYRVACIAPSINTTNLAQRLRLPHAYVTVEPVTNRTHLVRNRQIIYPILTRKTPSALSCETRRHAIIYQMAAQGGFLLDINYEQQDSSYQSCYEYEEKWVYHSLRTIASDPPGPPVPLIWYATNSTSEKEISRVTASRTS